jgi:hypothetical protein
VLIVLKQAAHLGGKDYKKGVHELSDEVLRSPFFLRLVKAGLAVEADAAKVVSAETEQVKQAKLINHILRASPKLQVAVPQPAAVSVLKGDEAESKPAASPSAVESDDSSDESSDFGSVDASDEEDVAKEKPSKKSKSKKR